MRLRETWAGLSVTAASKVQEGYLFWQPSDNNTSLTQQQTRTVDFTSPFCIFALLICLILICISDLSSSAQVTLFSFFSPHYLIYYICIQLPIFIYLCGYLELSVYTNCTLMFIFCFNLFLCVFYIFIHYSFVFNCCCNKWKSILSYVDTQATRGAEWLL